jgi:hypothetical protein
MKIFHHTALCRASDQNVVEFDETLNDYIWVRINWFLVTRDIDMANEGGTRKFVTLYSTLLPYPNIAAGKFIPFDNVGDRDLLRWIHETEGSRSIIDKQRRNLAGFIREYNLFDEWKGNI